MMIPKLHYISQGNSPKEHLENIQKACTSGVELVQLDLRHVSDKELLKFAKEAREITSHYQTRLILKEHYKIAKEIKADGVHIEKKVFSHTAVREHLYTWQIIGATANTLQDCEKFIDNEVDYISLSTFRSTGTKDNLSSVLGLSGFTAITKALKTETPIIGFGGITTDDVTDILKTGVSGIAVSEEITQNFDAIRTYNLLLNASITEEQRHSFK